MDEYDRVEMENFFNELHWKISVHEALHGHSVKNIYLGENQYKQLISGIGIVAGYNYNTETNIVEYSKCKVFEVKAKDHMEIS